MFVFFDDCWNPDPALGPQQEPVQGEHNSRWVQSPSRAVKLAESVDPRLPEYVRAVVQHFGKDDRIFGWDVYNEPGNSHYGAQTLPLLEAAFEAARAAHPLQPVFSGVWLGGVHTTGQRWSAPEEITDFQLAASDITTFHMYEPPDAVEATLDYLQSLERPIVCTEFMARSRGSTIQAIAPLLVRRGVGMYCWGLVAGRSQTNVPWREDNLADDSSWFADLLTADGKPYDPAEIDTLRRLTRTNN